MNHIYINGSPVTVRHRDEDRMADLLQYVRQNYTEGAQLITSLKVNGTELNGEDPHSYDMLLLLELDSVEIQMAFPQEIAEETLQSLRQLVRGMPELCRSLVNQNPVSLIYSQTLKKLIDQIEILGDTVTAVKSVLRTAPIPEVEILEQELVATLRDLLSAHEGTDSSRRIQILQYTLPQNLERWENSGIPSLIRSKDC